MGSTSSFLFLLHGALGEADGTRGADEAAEVTAYAFGTNQTWAADICVERDSLMTRAGSPVLQALVHGASRHSRHRWASS